MIRDPLQRRLDIMSSHPGRIWLRSWTTDRTIHFKITDCENTVAHCGQIAHLCYFINENKWGGTLRNYNTESFILTSRQAFAMFEGYFDWMYDFFENVK